MCIPVEGWNVWRGMARNRGMIQRGRRWRRGFCECHQRRHYPGTQDSNLCVTRHPILYCCWCYWPHCALYSRSSFSSSVFPFRGSHTSNEIRLVVVVVWWNETKETENKKYTDSGDRHTDGRTDRQTGGQMYRISIKKQIWFPFRITLLSLYYILCKDEKVNRERTKTYKFQLQNLQFNCLEIKVSNL